MPYVILAVALVVTLAMAAYLWFRPVGWWSGWRCLAAIYPSCWLVTWIAAGLRLSGIIGSQPVRLAVVIVPTLLVIALRPRWLLPPGVR